MFRCVSQLSGLIIDVDSFTDFIISDWLLFTKNFSCLFFTKLPSKKLQLDQALGNNSVELFESFPRLFMPHRNMLATCLKKLNCNTTNIAFISCDYFFLRNALAFTCGNIWISKAPYTYEQASSYSDIVVDNVSELFKVLSCENYGFLGEVVSHPHFKNTKNSLFAIETTMMTSEDHLFSIISTGRYFGKQHYMNNLHPLSTRILANKRAGKNSYKSQDGLFTNIYSSTIKFLLNSLSNTDKQINTICSVPARPGCENRFSAIVNNLASQIHLEDISKYFLCTHDYKSQKASNRPERYDNVKNAFSFNDNLSDKNVVLLDDVVSTGATICACVDALYRAHANNVYVVTLAINQTGYSYWSSDFPKVSCPKCGDKMMLLLNSWKSTLFFSCYGTHPEASASLDYDEGLELLINKINNEIPIISNEDINQKI